MTEWLGRASSGFGPDWLLRAGTNEDGDVVTFYSYKGGTGRSLALVNCAGLIAQHLPNGSRPLLLIDFDLEAPGLHRYLAPYLHAQHPSLQGGVLELFEDLLKAVESELASVNLERGRRAKRLDDEAAARVVGALDLQRYITETRLDSVFLVKAGRFDAAYDSRLSRFRWKALFDKAPALFRCLADRLARNYAFVFIDSRTGLSDTTGVSTMLLPDVLVMVFTPNSQSLTGVEHLVRRAVDYRATSSDLRALRVYPLPSRVDVQVEHFRRVWRTGQPAHPLFGDVLGYEPMFLQVFKDAFRIGHEAEARVGEYFDVVQIPHSSDYAYGERLCFASAASSDSLSLRGAYEQFLPWIVTGAQPWQRPADVLYEQQAERLLSKLGATPDDDIGWQAWLNRLSTEIGQQAEQLVAQAPQLSNELRANMNLAVGLALAHNGDLQRSTQIINRESALAGIQGCYSALALATVQILTIWRTTLVPVDVATEERQAWLIAAHRLHEVMNPGRSLAAQWSAARASLLDHAPWLCLTPETLRRVRETDLGQLGGDQRDGMLRSIRNASLTMKVDGDLAGARLLEEQVLDIRRRVFGEEHEDTLAAQEDLARTLRAEGDAMSALELETRTRKARRRRVIEDRQSRASVQAFRVFLSSPGDVATERYLAREIIEEIGRSPRLRGKARLEVVSWDETQAAVPMTRGDAPQSFVNRSINRPGECDLTVIVLWSRMGIPLPLDLARGDDTRFESGTVWEYEDAVSAEKPVLVYRRTARLQIDIDDSEFDGKRAQYEAVKRFFARFTNPDGSLNAAYTTYADPAEFGRLLRQHLEAFVIERLVAVPQPTEPAIAPVDADVARFLALIEELGRRDAETTGLEHGNEQLQRGAIARILAVSTQFGSGKAWAAAAQALEAGDTRPAEALLRGHESSEGAQIGRSGADDSRQRRKAATLAHEQGALALGRDVRVALAAFQRAAEYEPGDIWTHVLIGDLEMQLGNMSAAMQSYRKVGVEAEVRLRSAPNDSNAQRDLSASHDKIGDVLMAQGDGAGALAAYRKGLAIRERLAARDPADTEWQRDLLVSHNKIGDVLMAQGDGPAALTACRKGLVIAEALAGGDPTNTQWQRDLSVSHNKVGDVLMAQGDGPAALIAYRNGLVIAEAAAAGDPTNTQWQRDLSVSHNNVGDVLVAQGDEAGALVAYRKGLVIAEAVAAGDPMNTQWQRDLSVSHNKIGDVLVAQGDGPAALAAFRKGLGIAEALATRDPGAAQWQRDLLVSHNKVGDVLTAQGDGPAALTAYRKGLAIAEALAARDPANTQWHRDLFVSHNKIGDVLVGRGDGPAALAAYRNGLAIAEALAVRDPANTQWQADLALSHERIGDVLAAQGDGAGALAAYQNGLAVFEARAARDRTNAQWQRDLLVIRNKIGDVLAARGEGLAALAAYQTALEAFEAQAARDPANTQWQRDLSMSHDRIGDVLVAQGDQATALAAYRTGLRIRETLQARDPANTSQRLMDVVISCAKLGTLTQGQTRDDRLGYLTRGREILATLSEVQPFPGQDLISWFDSQTALLESEEMSNQLLNLGERGDPAR